MAEQKIFGITIGKKKENPTEPTETLAAPFSPTTPSVNFIPGEVLTGYSVEKLIKRFFAAGIVLILALAGVWAAGKHIENLANKEIREVEQEKTAFDTQTQALAPYRTYFSSVDSKRATIANEMSLDTQFATIASELTTAASQSGISLSNITVNVASPNSQGRATGCPSPDPFNSTESIGCVTFSGSAADRNAINAFVTTLNSTDGFVNAYIPSSSADAEQGSGIAGSVAFTSELYTQRYQAFAVPLQAVVTGETPPENADNNDTAPTPNGDITP